MPANDLDSKKKSKRRRKKKTASAGAAGQGDTLRYLDDTINSSGGPFLVVPPRTEAVRSAEEASARLSGGDKCIVAPTKKVCFLSGIWRGGCLSQLARCNTVVVGLL